MINQGLALALREKIYPQRRQAQQKYLFKKDVLIFFLLNTLENDDELIEDQEDFIFLQQKIIHMQNESFVWPSSYLDYYFALIEENYLQNILRQSEDYLMTKSEQDACLLWAQQDIPLLTHSQHLSELMIYDLFHGLWVPGQTNDPDN